MTDSHLSPQVAPLGSCMICRTPIALILSFTLIYNFDFFDRGGPSLVTADYRCPNYTSLSPMENVTKAWRKPCVADFEYCIPPKGAVSAQCPGKLVYNPQRGRCDIRKTCKITGVGHHKIDLECMDKACGLYPSVNCKKYFICSGGAKIWKECPGETLFDFEREECIIGAKCRYPVEPITPSDLPVDDGIDPADLSREAECPYHDFPEPIESEPWPTQSENEPTGIIVESTMVTDVGQWSAWKTCPDNHYFTGMTNWKRSTLGKDNQYDHAGIISVGFRCENFDSKIKKDKIIGACAPGAPDTVWNYFLNCQRGAVVGFQLNQLADQGPGDDRGTDNLKAICSCGIEKELVKPYHEDLPKYAKVGGEVGQWTEKKYCNPKQALCGFKAQLESWVQKKVVDVTRHDMTGLNQIHFKCCDVRNPATHCDPVTRKRYLQSCDNLDGFASRPCRFETFVGTLYNYQNKSRAVAFYTSIGFEIEELFEDLRENIESKLPKCASNDNLCQYLWLRGSSNVQPQTVIASPHDEFSDVSVPPGVKVQILQTVVQCGIYEIYTNQILVEPKTVREGTPTPPPELFVFELQNSLSFAAK